MIFAFLVSWGCISYLLAFYFIGTGAFDWPLAPRNRTFYVCAILLGPVTILVAIVRHVLLFCNYFKNAARKKLIQTSDRRNPIQAKFRKKKG